MYQDRGQAKPLCWVELAMLFPGGALVHMLYEVYCLKLLVQLSGSFLRSQSCRIA